MSEGERICYVESLSPADPRFSHKKSEAFKKRIDQDPFGALSSRAITTAAPQLPENATSRSPRKTLFTEILATSRQIHFEA